MRRVVPAIHGSDAGAPTPPLGPIGPPLGETPSVPSLPPPLLGVWGTTEGAMNAPQLLNDLISPREERGRHIEPEGILRGVSQA